MRIRLLYRIVLGLLASLATGGCTDRVEAGRQLYLKHGCAVCHGAGGHGDGPSATRLVVPPRDFENVDAYREGSTAEAIASTIRFGTSVPGPMPPFAHISAEDALLIADWIVSVQRPAASAAAESAADIVLRDAWVRESTATRTVSSGYVTIENPSVRDLTLVGVAVDGAERIELHTVRQDGGDAVMHGVESVRIPARSSVALAPGGTHLMLFDVDPPLVAGESANMTLTFDDQRQETVRAVVRPLAAMSAR